MCDKTPKEPSPREILLRNVKAGFVESRNLTKEDTYRFSKDIKNSAWKSGEELINSLADNFFNVPPPKKYPILSSQKMILLALYTELVKSFQNSFRLAEEGYYRSAFGELRDMLELVMKIKLFYEEEKYLKEWAKDPNRLLVTKEMRSFLLFKNSGLNEEIEKLSNVFSNNRHSSSHTMDAVGPLLTNACYYRRPLFEKWCKHVILLKDLGIKIIKIK